MTDTRTAKPRVVVAGLGDTGLLVATRLTKRCDVVGISTRPALVSGQELGNRLTAPDQWRQSYLIPHHRFHRLDEVRTLHGRITSVDLAGREVHVVTAAGDPVTEPYDILVIATGASNVSTSSMRSWRQNPFDAPVAITRMSYGSVTASPSAVSTCTLRPSRSTEVMRP